MEVTLLHPEETQESNSSIETVVEITEESVETPETDEAQKEQTEATETVAEPTVEIDGEQVPISEVKRLREEYKNDSNWKDKNRRTSEELNAQRKELAQLELIKPLIEQHPEILQQLFTPKQNQNFETELQAHLSQEPDATQDWNAWRAWNFKKDELAVKVSEERAVNRLRTENLKRDADDHNLRLSNQAAKDFVDSGKATREEVQEMANWIVANIKDKNGRYPDNAFDIAYKATMNSDKEIRQAKLDATKSVQKSIEKAKPADSVNGANKRDQMTAEDIEEQEFIARAKAKVR